MNASPRAIDPSCGGLFPLGSDEGRPVLRDDRAGLWITRAALRAEVMALAEAMAAPRKRLVFLFAGNAGASVRGLLAAAAAGHAVALIDPTLPGAQIDTLLAAYRPEILLSSEPFDALPETVWQTGTWTRRPEAGQFPALAIDDADREAAIHDELFLMLSTSGTTGSPKFVRLSLRAVVANARQIAEVLGIGAESVAIAHLPLHYSYGLSVVTSHIVAGGSVFVMEDAITSASFWSKVAEAGGTHFPGVPFHYTVLARLGFGLMPACVGTMTQAGGALDLRLQKGIHAKATERGARFFVMYGQTEAAPRMTTLAWEDFDAKAGSVGPALPGGRLGILDPDGLELPPGQTGAVVYDGPNVMLGYAERRADLSRGDEMGGRLETGDLGRLDDAGCLFLSGRSKRFAKVAGLRLSLDEIEAMVADLAPVACLDEGERIVVCTEATETAVLKQRFRALAQQFKIPSISFVLRTVELLPRRSSGKVDFAKLKELARV